MRETVLLSMMALSAVVWCSGAQSETIRSATYTETITAMSEYVQEIMETRGVPGMSIALIDNEEIVWAEGFGISGVNPDQPVTTDTVFHIGSVSKMFVTSAIMILMEQGLVDLEQPVSQYIPEFQMLSDDEEDVTVRTLLNHQSGIQGSLYRNLLSTVYKQNYDTELLDWLASQYSQYPAQYTSVYCNNGFTLLEIIVERVSGQDYLDFLQENIFNPLEMFSSGTEVRNEDLADRLSGGFMGDELAVPEIWNMYGTGGLTSHPRDLCRFLAMIAGEGEAYGVRVLEPTSVTLMGQDQPADSIVNLDMWFRPGLGWDTMLEPSLQYAGTALMKSGGTLLFESNIAVMPEYGLGVAVNINCTHAGAAIDLCQRILSAALAEQFGVPVPPPLEPVLEPIPPPFEFSEIEGVYGSSSLGGLVIVSENNGLLDIVLWVGDQPTMSFPQLVYRANGFFVGDENPEMGFQFVHEDGRILILNRRMSGHYERVTPIGERLAPPADNLVGPWADRIGTVWVPADIDPHDYLLPWSLEVLQFGMRQGYMVYEHVSNRGADRRTAPHVLDAPLVNEVQARIQQIKQRSDGMTVGKTHALQILSDDLAWVPLQVDSRDLAHLRILTDGDDGLLQGIGGPTLWRLLDTIPVLGPSDIHDVTIEPPLAQWVKLVDGAKAPLSYQLAAASSVRWMRYNERFEVEDSGWGAHVHFDPDPSSSCWYLMLMAESEQPMEITVSNESPLVGDVNDDGVVNSLDLLMFLEHWLQQED